MGPVDLWQDSMSYGGDKRRMRFGYLLSPPKDPAQSTVLADAFSVSRADVVGSAGAAGLAPEKVQWPNSKSQAEAYSLSWLGFTNRYFAAAVYPLIDVKSSKVEKRLAWVGDVVRVIPTAVVNAPGAEVVGLRMDSVPVTLAAGGSADLSHGIFAGPMDKRVLTGVPRLASLGLKGLPHYNFGGPCAFCTFETITSFLLWLLTKIHLIVGDWAIGIFILVVIVRTCLHPITKSTQIRMARFGKQMAAVGPKQKQLQEKYKNDPRKLQEETAKLWREEGISPAGLLGCLPTFLQTPVWIALSATLYFAVELRHQHAFFGLFQSIQPKVSPFWHFLGDLAEPDRLLYFGHSVANLPLLGSIESVNILPIILGIVLFIQQKYMTPPATTTLTPEQEFQQKLTKWMMVIMFPLMMYNAPSGLALYFLVNSTLGILEARYVRAHMEKYDLLNLDKQKAAKAAKKGGGGGFMERLQAAAEEKRAEYERRAKEQNKRGGR
jgi:YidC/Oxa1 family membrane protein insertase